MTRHPSPPTLLALAACAVLVACDVGPGERGGDRADLDLPSGGEATLEEGDLFAIRSRDGQARLGLTRDEIYVRMSDELLAEIDREMDEGAEDAGEGIGGDIARGILGGVSEALRTSVGVDVADVEDVQYREGAIVLVGAEDAFRRMRFDDEPVLEKFAEEDVRAFAEAFRELKAGEEADPRGG